VIAPSPNANKHIINQKGLEYILKIKRKGSVILETFLRGLANKIK
jgi:hypothetical protein